jgi:hypothetical protein
MKWGVFPVGRSRVTSAWIEREGRRLLAIRYRTRTNRLFNKVYPMDDRAEAIIDPETFLPVQFSFRKKRWRTACDDIVTFDYTSGVARIESRCEGWRKSVAINREVRDIITFMYWMRRTPIPAGMDQTFRVMTNQGVVNLRLRAEEEWVEVDLPVFGATRCLRVTPEVDLATMLVEEGKVALWVADDERRLAPRLDVQAPLASVRTLLSCVRGPGDDRWTEAAQNGNMEEECTSPDD